MAKFQNRVLVYGVEGGFPMFFDVDGRGSEIYPTVFALWKAPDLLPAFTLKGGEVSRFIIGGADLMFPGISIPAAGLPSFLAGEPWAVKVPGNPAPIAVGATTVSSTEALKAGLRGKALRVTHYYHDSLWESVGHFVPNAGFLNDVVYEDPAASSSVASYSCEDDASNEHHSAVGSEEAINAAGADPANVTLLEENISEQVARGIGVMSITNNVSVVEPNVEDQQSLSVEDVDALLDKCLLQALHTSVKDKDLPIPGSTLCFALPTGVRPSTKQLFETKFACLP